MHVNSPFQQERKLYEYVLADGKIVHKQTVEPLDTTKGPKGAKWIFVMSTSRRLYAGVVLLDAKHFSQFLLWLRDVLDSGVWAN